MPTLDPLIWIPTGTAVFLLGVLGYVITHPEIVEKWKGILGSGFSWLSAAAERHAVAGTIVYEIDSFAKALNKLVPSSLPLGIKVKWVTEKDEAFLEKDQVVVLMRHHQNNARNLATACYLFMSEGLLPSQRLLIDDETMEAVEMVVAEKALISRNRPDALRILDSEFVAAIVKTQPRVAILYRTVKGLEPNGMLTTVFLPEIAELAIRSGGTAPVGVKEEVRDFLSFLQMYVERTRGQNLPSNVFEGRYLRVGIILVGAYQKVRREYVAPYVQAITFSISRLAHRDYLLAIGKTNVMVAREAGAIAQEAGLGRVKAERGYITFGRRGKVLEGISIAFEPIANV